MNAPRVSIVIPCRNAGPWLAATLDSALAQTWPEKEILLIDDGSSDDSLAIARSYEKRGVRVFVQAGLGAAAARNAGLREARGDYVQFIDADDLLTPDKLAAQVTRLESQGRDCVASCRWGRFMGDPGSVQFVDDAVFRDLAPLEFLLLHTGGNCMMHPAAWLTPRGVADQAGPWNEALSLNDDGEYFARVVQAARRIVYSPTGATFYRSRLPGSLSQRRSVAALRSLAQSVELIAGHVRRLEDSPRVRHALADYWQRLAYELYPEVPDLRRRAAAQVRALGGSDLAPAQGRRERFLARLVGWRLARRLRGLLRR